VSFVEGQTLLDLRDLVEKVTGIFYLDSSLPLLRERVEMRVAALGVKDLLDYYYYLKWDPRREAEWESLLQHLTVNETHFWRESDALEWAVAQLLRQRAGKNCSRVWHAACSSGEEPYSLAMAAMGAGLRPGADFELLASDLDAAILSAAMHAQYTARALRHLPERLRERYCSEGDKGCLLASSVRAAVRFFRLNLHEANVAWPVHCDIVFCRNVFIYFRPPTVRQVVLRFAQCLKPGGFLVLGAAESLLKLDTPFEFTSQDGVIVYRKPVVS
jgi:chemotaxis protein methyltransferase CheR